MDCRLHHHAALDADDRRHAEEMLDRRCRRCVAAALIIGKKMRRPEDVEMGVAGARRGREPRLARIGVGRKGDSQSRLYGAFQHQLAALSSSRTCATTSTAVSTVSRMTLSA